MTPSQVKERVCDLLKIPAHSVEVSAESGYGYGIDDYTITIRTNQPERLGKRNGET